MARVSKPLPKDVASQAAVVRARRELAGLDELRFVQRSVDAGVTQAALAAALGASPATVSRLVKKLASEPELTRPSVEEVVRRAVVGDISRKEMVQRLCGMRLAYVRPDRKPDSGWAQFARAVRSGLITKREALSITEDVAGRLVARVDHSMNLEGQPVPSESTVRLVNETTQKLMAEL